MPPQTVLSHARLEAHQVLIALLRQASAVVGRSAGIGECECPLVGHRGLKIYNVLGRRPNQVQKKRYGSCLGCLLLISSQTQHLL